MLYKNALIFTESGSFVHGSFRVEDGKFTEILTSIPQEPGVDLAGASVIPGLVDIHIHGCAGADVSDGDAAGLRNMASYLASHGITSFVPASMTLPYEVLGRAYSVAADFHRESPVGCARLMGVHMEGPFFSEKRKGGQNAAYLKAPDFAAFQKLYHQSKGLLRIVDIAAELPGAVEFTQQAAKLCTVSVAHTDATYEEAQAVFDAGATHLTHLFNAMPGIHHRNPGPIGAASETNTVIAELIGDGYHVHPSAIRMAFQLFPGRICLISDALRCCGMGNGRYEVGGQTVLLEGNLARLEDGVIAGSATHLFDCLRRIISFGIPMKQAILSATAIPARQIGCSEIGAIAPGKLADFIVCSKTLDLLSVYMGGKQIS